MALLILFGCSESDKQDLGYCDVEPIIEQKCVRCHSDPPVENAPMALTTYEQVYHYRTKMAANIKNGSMPFLNAKLSPEVEELTDDEYDMLLDWLDDGAPKCD